MARSNLFPFDVPNIEDPLLSFEVNSYKIYYYANAHGLLPRGLRLLETPAAYGDTNALITSFKKLLSYDVNDTILINAKLTPTDTRGTFYCHDFETVIMSQNSSHLQFFFIHYPAAPNYNAVDHFNMPIHVETWLAVSRCNNPSITNAIGVYAGYRRHDIQLTEVVAVGPMVQRMQWYSYHSYSYGCPLTNLDLVDHPVVIATANRYNITPNNILMLWALQRNENIIPKITDRQGLYPYYTKEPVVMNLRLSELDLSTLDIAVMQMTPRLNIFY